MVAEDLTGRRFGFLSVLNRNGSNKIGKAKWLCQCDCGKQIVVLAGSLKTGNTLSCGCLRRGNNLKHGQYRTLTYQSWRAMIQRCTNSRHRFYPGYGGRGIAVCQPLFDSFINFYADMGDRPDKRHTLDRIKVNKGYFKENCRWASLEVQANNKRPRSKTRKEETVPF